MRLRSEACAWAAAMALLFCTTRASADNANEKEREKGECIAASDEGQQSRDDGKYKRAREAFVRCARATCPSLVSHDCAQWLVDVDARAPTVVIDGKDEQGNDLADVTVQLDGAPFAAKLDGLPRPVDPGQHVFRYETPGLAPLEEQVLIRAGERNRVLRVRFGPVESSPEPTPQPGAESPSASGRTPEATERSRSSAPAALAWVFAGTALGAFASESYFGIAGLGQRSGDLSGPGKCAPQCPYSERVSIQTKFAVADVSLVAGIVSAGLAAYFFLRTGEPKPAPQATFDLTPHNGGGVASMTGRF